MACDRDGAQGTFDIVIVGAGFGGLYMLHLARKLGLTARVLEAGDGVGGTWYWNRYPGARCDVESMEYSYQFCPDLEQEWEWTERYAPQPEILRYANHVADRFDLRGDIQFKTRVTAASFDDATGTWAIATEDGGALTSRYLVMATGCLSSTNSPSINGLEDFKGPVYHTGTWPHDDVDFTGLRVGVIGTGSSAIQSIPIIAEQAAELFVFQRTPNYAVPAQNHLLDPDYQREVKANYGELRARASQTRNGVDTRPNDVSALAVSDDERQTEYEARWQHGGLPFMAAFNDLLVRRDANDTARAFLCGKIREIVDDPAVAELLSPTNVVGCKRLCIDTNYYATYNRDNVTLVDVSETPIEAITPEGLNVDGRAYAVDVIVLATGFDAMTGALLKVAIQGRGGETLQDKWAAGPRTYLGLMSAGFPNLFMITGPGSPSVLTNMLPSIEQHAEWIAGCLGYLVEHGHERIEPTHEAENNWVDHVNDLADHTLYPTCNSWYLGANVPGKPRVFMPHIGYSTYVRHCEEVVAKGYEGFALR
ncbi:MAG: NAD(P)/FAD-dependent oxidoreductase [Pseudomonadota bacterium]